jgi:hypothetical protein
LSSAGLIVGLRSPGPIRSMMSWRPLVLLGLVSYGAYLFHWPVFLLLEAHGRTLSNLPGFVLAVSITCGCAAVSYVLLEQPIRRSDWGVGTRGVGRVAAAALIATVVALVVVAVTPESRSFLEADTDLLEAVAIKPVEPTRRLEPIYVVETVEPVPGSLATPAAPAPLGAAPNRPLRLLIVGDSTAFFVGHGLAQWAQEHPAHAQVDLLWSQGFGLLTTGTVTAWDATAFVDRSAELMNEDLPALVARVQPDVVVFMSTVGDVMNREWSADEGVLASGDTLFQDRLADAYRSATSQVLAAGVGKVVWIIPPVPTSEFEATELEQASTYGPQHDVIRRIASEFGPAVSTIDLDQWMNVGGHADDASWRPDGTHLTDESAHDVAVELLGPMLVQIVVSPH